MEFEKRYVIDNSREADGPRERHYTIELSDRDHLERLTPTVSKDMEEARFVYKPPTEENMTPSLKAKFELAKKITKDTKVVDLSKKTTKKGKKT